MRRFALALVLLASPAWAADVRLDWGASTDNVGVAGYRVYRGGALVATVPPSACVASACTYTDTGLAAGTSYSYTISAYDAAGNESAQTAAVNVTTLGGGGEQDSGTVRNVACSGDITSALNSAISSSATGDTVKIGAGSCSMSQISIQNKNIQIKGAGITTTNISAPGGFGQWEFTENNVPRFRLAHIHFIGTQATAPIYVWANQSATLRGGFRIDHVHWDYPAGGNNVSLFGPIWGLLDHNVFKGNWENHTIINFGVNGETYCGQTGTAMPFTPGGSQMLYYEDNTFSSPNGGSAAPFDTTYCGMRVVFRYNTINSGALYMHWTSAGNINTAWFEIYGNTSTRGAEVSEYPFRIHGGGTGLIYNNTFVGWPANYVAVAEGRNPGQGQSASPLLFCDGTHNWDGNFGDPSAPGWPCLSQTGRDAGKSFAQITGGNKQGSFPLYVWNNGPQAKCSNPSAGGAACDNSFGVGILGGQDAYFKSTPHPNGDVDWHKSASQPSGAGTHTLIYTPWTYPYPLSSVGMPVP